MPARKTTRKARSTPRAEAPPERPPGVIDWLRIRGATHHNLQSVDAAFPLGRFTCVTGVSGSGKSSLVNDILYEALARDLNGAVRTPGTHAAIEGLEHLDKIIAIDQSPIGRTPRSNPATYIKVFDEIRNLFAKLPDAKLRGYKPGRFSFNVASGPRGGGRCEVCEGNGARRVEMDFLADVWVTCPICDGRRFSRETMQIQFKHKSIADVLQMDIQDALAHFDSQPRIRMMLQTLHDVGLDYLKLGQASTTLSGGEAQRVKLARELVKRPTGRTIYVLDEPTTGLHFEDISKLLAVLHGFVDAGNTVVVIEHNLDVIKTADWLIDLGPEGGASGGRIIATGTPEDVAQVAESHTGAALKEVLAPKPRSRRPARRKPAAAAATAPEAITVRGARQHNLKDLTISVPRDEVTVCTGVSGSGKTSFAIDTVFTEGYRRYVESLSAYARQFLGQMAKPQVDHVEGLSPAICIEQKAASKSPRSTVGTITEIYDYMRVLWARVGQAHCPRCRQKIGAQTVDEIVDRIFKLNPGTPIMLLAPVRLQDQETYAGLFNRLKASGYTRVRIDGTVSRTAEATTLDRRSRHRVEVVIDRTTVKTSARGRIAESVEHAVTLGDGMMTLISEAFEIVPEDGEADGRTEHLPEKEFMFSQKLACLRCDLSFEELSPHNFSFNSQMGWCETCEGLGMQRGAPERDIIVEPTRSLFRGAIAGWDSVDKRSQLGKLLLALCAALDVPPDTPLSDWTAPQKQALMFGYEKDWVDGQAVFADVRFQWRGFFPAIDAATRNSWTLRHRLQNSITDIPCIRCRGGRLRADAAAMQLGGRTIVDLCNATLTEAAGFFKKLRLSPSERRIAGELLIEIRNRLRFLLDVGLEYLTLHRAAPTLSGGEAQRIRLASQIGSGLSGVLYVLDEPTIGLHPRDTRRLIKAIQRLRDLGNTVLMVEHDRDVIASADGLLDFGPEAGSGGGEIVAQAPPARLARPASARRFPRSRTAGYLRGAEAITIPSNRRPVPQQPPPRKKPPKTRRGRPKVAATPAAPDGPVTGWLQVLGARHNNLRNLDVAFPLGRLIGVTGVSGSGKSSLINDVLYPAAANRLQNASHSVGGHRELQGLEHLDKVVMSDQSPLGTTPSSNPATYTGAFDLIRELFARVPDSKVRGYDARRFSFNRPGGRCEACEGYGQRCIEMHFMPDVWVECEVCHGRRYDPETLEVRFKGRNIADVLEMRVREALDLFENVPKVRRILQMLADVGLDYVQLGQPAPTLSGGEAQRVKLANELSRPDTGRTLFILDEPTTGLHFEDVRKLLEVLHRLVDLGNTVIVIEHNLDVLTNADWLLDLGPEAGADGGLLVGAGTPEQIAALPQSHTGVILADVLAAGQRDERDRFDPNAYAAAQLAAEKGGFGNVGKNVQMPWQTDGRMWHVAQRTDRNGRPRQWEAAALEYVVAQVEKIDGFEPTNWNNRASVEITAAGAPTWFMHALTGGEWLLELYFRAPKGHFDWRELDERLGLKTLDEREDLQTYGDWSRVDVRSRRDGYDAVVVYPYDQAEIETKAFRKFLAEAAKVYFESIVGRPRSGRKPRRPGGRKKVSR